MYTCPNGCGASKAEHICYAEHDNAQERAMRLRIEQLEQAIDSLTNTSNCVTIITS